MLIFHYSHLNQFSIFFIGIKDLSSTLIRTSFLFAVIGIRTASTSTSPSEIPWPRVLKAHMTNTLRDGIIAQAVHSWTFTNESLERRVGPHMISETLTKKSMKVLTNLSQGILKLLHNISRHALIIMYCPRLRKPLEMYWLLVEGPCNFLCPHHFCYIDLRFH